MSLETGPVINTGYYDVPICNKYSNEDDHSSPTYVDGTNLNTHIQLVMNNNKNAYLVNENPTQPSESLFVSNKNNNNVFYENISKYENKDNVIYKELPTFPVYDLENFDGYFNLRLNNINIVNIVNVIILLLFLLFIICIFYLILQNK